MTLRIADRVKETTTTTGTGALTLAGAMTGFRAFSSVCTSPSDTCYYAIQGVDGSGVATGEWEVGLGTYSGANTLTRTTVLSSSNANAVVSLSAGTKQVWIDLAASDYAGARGQVGAAASSSAADITLTAASNFFQVVTMSAAGKSVLLPDATTLAVGKALFVVKNASTSITLCVRDSASKLLVPLLPAQIAVFYLTDNSSAAGAWAVGNESAASFLLGDYFGASQTMNATAMNSGGMSIVALSSTQAIVTVSLTSAYLWAYTLNISGATITAGAAFQVTSVGTYYPCLAFVSSTQAILCYRGTSNYVYARTLNVSGTTLSAGAELTVNALTTNYMSVTSLSSTQAIIAFQGTTSYLTVCTLNVSGTTLTAGANCVVNAYATTYIALCALTSTQAVCGYVANSTTQAVTLNVSGTSISAGSVLTVISTNTNGLGIAATSSSTALIVSNISQSWNCCVLSVSGTTITANAIAATAGTTFGNYVSLTLISASMVVLTTVTNTGSYLSTVALSVTSTTVGVGAITVLQSQGASYGFFGCALTSSIMLGIFNLTTNYLGASLFEPVQ